MPSLLFQCHRQKQVIAAAQAAGAYKGRCEDAERNKAITAMLRSGRPRTTIQNATVCSSSTVHKLAKRLREQRADHPQKGVMYLRLLKTCHGCCVEEPGCHQTPKSGVKLTSEKGIDHSNRTFLRFRPKSTKPLINDLSFYEATIARRPFLHITLPYSFFSYVSYYS